jgi:hypothetical protein
VTEHAATPTRWLAGLPTRTNSDEYDAVTAVLGDARDQLGRIPGWFLNNHEHTELRTRTRPRSPTISTWRRRIRSTHAPAGKPTTRNANVPNVVSKPTSRFEALRENTATSGSASTLIWLPNWLIESATNNCRKSWARKIPRRPARFTLTPRPPKSQGQRLPRPSTLGHSCRTGACVPDRSVVLADQDL